MPVLDVKQTNRMVRMFSPPQTRAQSLASDIERLIRERGLKSGERIATMDQLRERTRLGRATISEAARLLAERGNVDVRPGRGGGLFVADATAAVRLRHTLLSLTVGQNAAAVADALAVRDVLEELIDVDAARHRSDDDIVALNETLERMWEAAAVSRDEFMLVNWELHEKIAQITPNEIARGVYLGTMHQLVGLPSHADAATSVDEYTYLTRRVEIHAELVAAISAGDTVRTSRAVTAHRGLTASLTG